MCRVNHPRLAVLALLAVAAAWGSTFFLTKDLLTRMDVADYLALRFLIASIALILVHPPAISRLSRLDRGRAVALGITYGIAQLVQTEGLRHTSASVSGFVTGMYVVFTPLLAAVILRHKIGRWAWVAVILATVGLGVLSLRGLSMGTGELLTLASAGLYALHIIGLGAWSTPQNAFGLSALQMVVITCVCGIGALPGGFAVPDLPGRLGQRVLHGARRGRARADRPDLGSGASHPDPRGDRDDDGAGVRVVVRRTVRVGERDLADAGGWRLGAVRDVPGRARTTAQVRGGSAAPGPVGGAMRDDSARRVRWFPAVVIVVLLAFLAAGTANNLARNPQPQLVADGVPGRKMPAATFDGPYGDLIRHAIADLDALTLPNGATLAGWDGPWRFVWPRDASFVAAAYCSIGQYADAGRVLDFLNGIKPVDRPLGGPVRRERRGDPGRPRTTAGRIRMGALGNVVLPGPAAKYWDLVRESADQIVAELGPDGLPAASPDYWERPESELTLGTVAPLLTGLRSAVGIATDLDHDDEAARWNDALEKLATATDRRFGPDYPRTPARAVSFLEPGLEPIGLGWRRRCDRDRPRPTLRAGPGCRVHGDRPRSRRTHPAERWRHPWRGLADRRRLLDAADRVVRVECCRPRRSRDRRRTC